MPITSDAGVSRCQTATIVVAQQHRQERTWGGRKRPACTPEQETAASARQDNQRGRWIFAPLRAISRGAPSGGGPNRKGTFRNFKASKTRWNPFRTGLGDFQNSPHTSHVPHQDRLWKQIGQESPNLCHGANCAHEAPRFRPPTGWPRRARRWLDHRRDSDRSLRPSFTGRLVDSALLDSWGEEHDPGT